MSDSPELFCGERVIVDSVGDGVVTLERSDGSTVDMPCTHVDGDLREGAVCTIRVNGLAASPPSTTAVRNAESENPGRRSAAYTLVPDRSAEEDRRTEIRRKLDQLRHRDISGDTP